MTTTTSTTAPSALRPTARPRTPVLHRAVGWAAVAGTLPYLTLKALWLARVDAGLPDPAMLTDSTMIAMNGITAAMDALVIALALALTHRWGYRLPAWLLLLLPAARVAAAATGVGRHRVPGADRGGEPACHGVPARRWQHSGRRFPGPLGGAAGLRRVRLALLYVLAGGGATMAVLSAGPHLAVGAAGGDAGAVLVHATTAAFALLGAASVPALARGATARRWIAVAAVWTGSVALLSSRLEPPTTRNPDEFGPRGSSKRRPHPTPHGRSPPMTANTATTTPTTSRAANVGLWTLQVLLAAVYAFSAFGKLTAEAQNVAGFNAMGLGTTGMYLVGALELAGAIAILVPRLTGLAALCFVALMVGAVTITWAMMGGGVLVAIPATAGVLAAVVAWGRRDSTRQLIAQLRR